MKNKLQLSIAVLLFFGLSNLQAQEVIPAAGGEANGSNGSVSYTVGQVFYTTNAGTNGNSIAQGVQQPYEISEISGIYEANDISLIVSAFPNPATDYLTLKVENYNTTHLQYQVFDITGKLLQTVKATGSETRIEIKKLVPANYFVKVIENQKEIKIFKIIKN